ncbi:hypothetical protein H8D30_03605 [bacterium]|nr:hypothetical protein [bacterium]
MNKKNSLPLGLVVYLAVAFILPLWLVFQMKSQGVASGDSANPMAGFLVVGLSFLPAIAAVIARLVGKEGFGGAGFKWMPGKVFWGLFLGGIGIAWLAFAFTALFGWAEIDLEMTAWKAEMTIALKAAMAAQGVSLSDLPPGFIEKQVGTTAGAQWITMAVGPFIGMFLAIGSTYGWYAYFLPRMAVRVGRRKAAIAVGVLAGVAASFMVMVAPEAQFMGHSVEEVALGSGIQTIFLAIIGSWVFLRWGSIWATGLVGASLGSHLAPTGLYLANPESGMATPFGLALWIPLAVVSFFVLKGDWSPWEDKTELLIEDAPPIPAKDL